MCSERPGIIYGQPMPGESPAGRREQRADRLARGGLLLVLGSVAVAVAGGIVAALTWQPSAAESVSVDPCPDPPCFGGEGLPSLADLPAVLPVFGLLLAAALGLPGLLLTATRLVRRRDTRRRRVLPFAAPLLVLVFMEVVPHLLNPCFIRDAINDRLLPGCSRGTHGVDVADRGHTLHHAVVGGIPAALGHRALLQRRRPDLVER
ncbi:MAG: hypothetical protein WD794_13255 [Mycobacteriales bacterium]